MKNFSKCLKNEELILMRLQGVDGMEYDLKMFLILRFDWFVIIGCVKVGLFFNRLIDEVH